MPLLLLVNFITGILSLGLWVSGIFLSWKLYSGAVQGTHFIVLTVVLFGISLFGKYFVLRLFPSSGKMDGMDKKLNSTMIRSVDQTQLHASVSIKPKKTVVVFIHGWSLNHKVWHLLLKNVKMENFVIWDLPGLGNSIQPATNEYDVPKLAVHLKSVLDTLAPSKIILVGHSIGGMTILSFCRLYPEYVRNRIQKIVLVNTTYTKPLKTVIFPFLLQCIELPILKPICYLTIMFSFIVKIMNRLDYQSGFLLLSSAVMGFGGKQSREELDFSVKLFLEANPGVVAKGVLDMLSFDETRTLQLIKVPTHIIASTKDKVTRLEASQFMNDKIKGSTLTINTAGHMSVLENVEDVQLAL